MRAWSRCCIRSHREKLRDAEVSQWSRSGLAEVSQGIAEENRTAFTGLFELALDSILVCNTHNTGDAAHSKNYDCLRGLYRITAGLHDTANRCVARPQSIFLVIFCSIRVDPRKILCQSAQAFCNIRVDPREILYQSAQAFSSIRVAPRTQLQINGTERMTVSLRVVASRVSLTVSL